MKRLLITIFVGTAALLSLVYFKSNEIVVTPTESPLGGKNATYFAEVDANGNVIRVIVADRAFIESGAVGDPDNWVQTYKNSIVRKNYAGRGFKYDKDLNAFIPPKPENEPGWSLNTETIKWEHQ